MIITSKTVFLALVIIFLMAFLWTRSAALKSSRLSPAPTTLPTPVSTPYETKEQSAGNVTVTVTPLKLTAGQSPQFQVVFDTHSVNLDFDVAAAASLTDDQGGSLGPATWDGTPAGGHHRSGRLTFAQPLPAQVKSITLTFTKMAGIAERTFTWSLSL